MLRLTSYLLTLDIAGDDWTVCFDHRVNFVHSWGRVVVNGEPLRRSKYIEPKVKQKKKRQLPSDLLKCQPHLPSFFSPFSSPFLFPLPINTTHPSNRHPLTPPLQPLQTPYRILPNILPQLKHNLPQSVAITHRPHFPLEPDGGISLLLLLVVGRTAAVLPVQDRRRKCWWRGSTMFGGKLRCRFRDWLLTQ